ncbi:MAG TPA: BTAD domain-containing putative transcriptional regulator [Chloroflexota bacterium]
MTLPGYKRRRGIGSLEIRLFGVFTAERDGRLLANLPSRKVRDLLAYLLLNRRTPRSREQTAALFWPDLDGDKARHCLNTTLWRLRGALRPLEGDHPYLRVDAQTIGFNPASSFRLDVEEFESHCTLADKLGPVAAEQQATLYRQAVALYCGDLLTDCYDDWCLVERERLQLLYLRALGRLLAYHARCGEYDAAITCAHRILERDPLREKVHRALIRLYLDANEPAAALRQYQACEEAVRRELGTDVTPETRALLARITAPFSPRLLTIRPPATVVWEPLENAPDRRSALVNAQAQLHDAVSMLHRISSELSDAATRIDAIQQQIAELAAAEAVRSRGSDGLHDRATVNPRPLREARAQG